MGILSYVVFIPTEGRNPYSYETVQGQSSDLRCNRGYMDPSLRFGIKKRRCDSHRRNRRRFGAQEGVAERSRHPSTLAKQFGFFLRPSTLGPERLGNPPVAFRQLKPPCHPLSLLPQ